MSGDSYSSPSAFRTVPRTGDVDPGQRRHGRGRPSRFERHMRFSFGPELPTLQEALRRLGDVVAEAR